MTLINPFSDYSNKQMFKKFEVLFQSNARETLEGGEFLLLFKAYVYLG